MSLQSSIERAQQDPNSPFAVELRSRIESGAMDRFAQQEGITLPGREAIIPEPEVQPTLVERGVEGVTEFAKGAERTLARTAAGAAPFLTAGIVSKEELQKKTGLEPAETFGEKALEVAGAGAGIIGQAIPIAKGVQLAGKAAQGLAALKPIGDLIRAGGITTAAIEGALAGVLQEGDLEERAKQAGVGAAIGGVLGGVIKGAGIGFSKLRKSFSNIDEATESVINPVAKLSKEEQAKFIKTATTQSQRASKLDKFLDAAETNARNRRDVSAMDLAVDAVEDTANKVRTLKSEAGKVIGDVKKKVGTKVVSNTKDIVTNLKKKLAERFNIGSVAKDGTLKPVKGRTITLDVTDQNRVANILNDVKPLSKAGVTINTSDDVKSIVRNNIDFDKAALKQDKLEKLLKEVDADIVGVQRGASTELAEANKSFSELANIEKELFKATGNKSERAVTILNRVLSERGKATKDLFERLATLTGNDLFEDAMFAKFSTEALGGEQAKSVLAQIIKTSVSPFGLIGEAAEAAGRFIAKPEKIAREIARPAAEVTRKGVIPAVSGVTAGAVIED